MRFLVSLKKLKTLKHLINRHERYSKKLAFLDNLLETIAKVLTFSLSFPKMLHDELLNSHCHCPKASTTPLTKNNNL